MIASRSANCASSQVTRSASIGLRSHSGFFATSARSVFAFWLKRRTSSLLSRILFLVESESSCATAAVRSHPRFEQQLRRALDLGRVGPHAHARIDFLLHDHP